MTESAEPHTGGASSRMHVSAARRLPVCVLVRVLPWAVEKRGTAILAV